MSTLIIFIIVLGILVLSHEFGHFIAARKSGMRVYEFGFGFTPRLVGIQRLTRERFIAVASTEKVEIKIDEKEILGQPVLAETIIDEKKEIDLPVVEKRWRVIWGNKEITEEVTADGWNCGTIYSLNWIPIGGFVRVKGEEGNSTDPDSFITAKTWKKAIMIVAGVVMNIILAGVLLSVSYMVGLPTSVDGMSDVSQVKDRQITIMSVISGKPAEAAGLQSGDEILKVGDLASPRLSEMQSYVDAHKTEEIIFSVKRGEETFEKKITPIIYEDTGRGGIGVSIAEIGTITYPWYAAIWHGFIDTFVYLKEIFLAFGALIAGLFAGHGAGDSVSGPIGIAVMTGQVAKMGFIYLLQFTALLSLNLAVLNILPLPALDGGRLLFLVLNKFKKINFAKYEQRAHAIGFILLMILVVVVTVKDLGTFRGVFLEFFKKIF